MRKSTFAARFLLLFILVATPTRADPLILGNDTYTSGSDAILSNPSPRSVFASGFNVDVKARVEKDVHGAGFNVNFDAPIGSDAYAAGFSVQVSQPIGGDLSAGAYSINLNKDAPVSGNARLAAKTITLDAPIAGSLLAGAGALALNEVVSGDAVLTVGTLTFGPNAKINGKLKYYAREPITIPGSVISADRVQFEKLEVNNTQDAISETTSRSFSGFWPPFFGIIMSFVLAIGFLVAMGAVLLAFAPRWMENSKTEALVAPVRITALGVLGLSMVIGLVPVSAMTLIGIPLIPLAILAAMALWILGYIVGAYAIGAKLGPAISKDSPAMGSKLAVLAVTLIVLSLINFIPFIGWLINLVVLFLGLGSILMQMARYITSDEAQQANVAVAAPMAAPTTTAARKPRGKK